MDKTAVIIGVKGQDGRILFGFLLKRKYHIIGIDKNYVQVCGAKWSNKIDITKNKDIFALIKKVKPNEIYYLAAFHHSSQDNVKDELRILNSSYSINLLPVAGFLEGIRKYSPHSRFFYAASSLVFGCDTSGIQDESTPFNPDSHYGISKLGGLLLCRLYRKKYGVFASVGIFYNHESAYRPKKFISRKIIQAAIDINNGKQDILKVGDLHATVDWGYAPDFMKAAYKIINTAVPDDFIVATGLKHTVLDWVKVSFGYFGLDWKKYVSEDKSFLSRKRNLMLGNAGKLFKITGWKPSINFENMIKKIIEDLKS